MVRVVLRLGGRRHRDVRHRLHLLRRRRCSKLAVASVDDAQAAAVQQALARQPADAPAPTRCPTPSTPAADQHVRRRARSRRSTTIPAGFAATDTAALAGGLVFNFIIALLIGLALLGMGAARPATSASRGARGGDHRRRRRGLHPSRRADLSPSRLGPLHLPVRRRCADRWPRRADRRLVPARGRGPSRRRTRRPRLPSVRAG